ncbi:hypothetical protein WUBG_14776 [Wuchereria bancrofti]|uniref:Uncharacterized protein n=1 Tax=Wuchereria bancrofti TaxID=6293 RepID=J9EBB0_WUCBA|nr:hypothetical protein WUBG_14776 [Wuchereria bancrofti]
MTNDDKGLPKKSEEVQFRILDFLTLQFLELISDIVGKAISGKHYIDGFRLADHSWNSRIFVTIFDLQKTKHVTVSHALDAEWQRSTDYTGKINVFAVVTYSLCVLDRLDK